MEDQIKELQEQIKKLQSRIKRLEIKLNIESDQNFNPYDLSQNRIRKRK